jgi:hypothetical protein
MTDTLARGLDAADIDGMVRNAARIKAAGLDFVLTYLKWTKPAHVAALHKAGLAVGLIFERDTMTTLTGSGADDGALARKQAQALGAPDDIPIFAAVDIGIGKATDLDRDGRPDADEVTQYFTDFKTGAGYVDGDLARSLDLAHVWLAGAMGWPGSRDYYANGPWHIVQGVPTRGGSHQLGFDWPSLGFEYDPDVARTLDWAWQPAVAPVLVPVVAPRPQNAAPPAAALPPGHLSPHFTLAEMIASDAARREGINNDPKDPTIVANLAATANEVCEPVRARFGPFSPNSGYRCPALNVAVGGSRNSQHMQGQAVDIAIPGVGRMELAVWCRDNLPRFDQIILEGTWVHVSLVKDGPNRGQCLTASGGGYVEGLHP